MIGVYDFCGHYDWTFEWLRQNGSEDLVRRYWDEAIHRDSQRHAAALIRAEGFAGMEKYWGHTLDHEGAGFHTTSAPGVFRIDMHDCPSKGFLLRNHLAAYHDYCTHCHGWIAPMLADAGFKVDHQHNHCGQCWWEFRQKSDPTPPSLPGSIAGPDDVRAKPDWNPPGTIIDSFIHSATSTTSSKP